MPMDSGYSSDVEQSISLVNIAERQIDINDLPKFRTEFYSTIENNLVVKPAFDDTDKIRKRGKCNIPVMASFGTYRQQKLETYGICFTEKISGYNNLSELYARILDKNYSDGLYLNLSDDEKQKVLLWFANYNTSVLDQLTIQNQISFWKCISGKYALSAKWIDSDHSKIIKSIANAEGRCIYCYVLFLGFYFVNNDYHMLFKIGKSNRNTTKRLIEHIKDVDYPDYNIVKIFRCSNETSIECKIKEHLIPYKIKWGKKSEVYASKLATPIISMLQDIEKYLAETDSIANVLQLKKELDASKLKNLRLQKVIKAQKEKADKLEKAKEELKEEYELVIESITDEKNTAIERIKQLEELLKKSKIPIPKYKKKKK